MEEKDQIFISYRRDGGEDLARLLEENLKDRGFNVFFDVESLRSGAFNTALFSKIDECADVLVVLPPHGLDRCVAKDDWVRQEIAYALKQEKNVIPILMRNFSFPPTLPEDIEKIRYMNGIAANSEFFSAVIEKLVTHFLKSLPVNGQISDQQLLDAVKRGDNQAMNLMGMRYETGSETLLASQPKALELYLQAAEAGNPGALFNLGDVYEQCSRDLTRLYDFAMDAEFAGVDSETARIRLTEKAEACYTKAADLGFLPAMYRLGNLREAQHDLAGAFELYRKAADGGFPPAQNAVGYFLMHGIACKGDPNAAIALYKKSAENGFAAGAYNYAQAMELINLNEAVSMYRKVAFGENAIPQAAYALGRIYETRLKDLHSAVTYYHIAAADGMPDAEKALKRCQDYLFASASDSKR
ncbi:MAG: toll/interleukin-1 receptor domain-containing protein [Clostridia bacterium]|nr:toll/interleukin-1 receptor domain-containing protein [Clostridia bacterium]